VAQVPEPGSRTVCGSPGGRVRRSLLTRSTSTSNADRSVHKEYRMTAEIVSESLIATLPGHTYVDDDVFRAEQERIFEQMWFCAVRSADLDKAGAYRTVQIGRESVIVTRNRKGAVRAYYNICRHRG